MNAAPARKIGRRSHARHLRHGKARRVDGAPLFPLPPAPAAPRAGSSASARGTRATFSRWDMGAPRPIAAVNRTRFGARMPVLLGLLFDAALGSPFCPGAYRRRSRR